MNFNRRQEIVAAAAIILTVVFIKLGTPIFNDKVFPGSAGYFSKWLIFQARLILPTWAAAAVLLRYFRTRG